MEGDGCTSRALKSSSSAAASCWLALNSSRCAAVSSRRREATDLLAVANRLFVSEAVVIGAGTAFRWYPSNLTGVGFLDVACLAVHAVRGVDLQFLAAFAVGNHFVHVRGAEVGTGV